MPSVNTGMRSVASPLLFPVQSSALAILLPFVSCPASCLRRDEGLASAGRSHIFHFYEVSALSSYFRVPLFFLVPRVRRRNEDAALRAQSNPCWPGMDQRTACLSRYPVGHAL